ncbi:MAG: hypothetical protein LBD06_01630 [Candidatus Accumulibacter sp.]|nr:hypothetical protein [Accumulibacter sp.]
MGRDSSIRFRGQKIEDRRQISLGASRRVGWKNRALGFRGQRLEKTEDRKTGRSDFCPYPARSISEDRA